MFKKFEFRVLVRILLLFCTLCATAFLLVKGFYGYMIVMLPLIVAEVTGMFKLFHKTQEELDQFVESVHYRDFSRHFDVTHAPDELKPMRKGFNDINSTFKVISREKETQYQYVQKILELVDTGILSYEIDGGDVIWMNESLKRILVIPYLKTIASLSRRDAVLFDEVKAMVPGESKIISVTKDKGIIKLLVSATAFQTDNKRFKLIAFQNVNEALDETEAKAWQKLLSVLTHEIMNSVAPISSLADTMLDRLHRATAYIEDPSTIEDLELGIDTIRRRSEGLLKFAETYRNLNKIISPTVKKVLIRDLFENLHHLMLPTFKQKNIELEVILQNPEIVYSMDATLIEQVLINLLMNAQEAVKDKASPRIQLSAIPVGNGRMDIKVADNGSGIPAAILDRIFIPFFSTRKNGSGIGLSLCQQIMLLHKGTIQVQSVESEGTAFILHF